MVHPPSRMVSYSKDMKFLWLLPAHLPPGRPLALGRGRILIPGFIRLPLTLAVYDVVHSLPLGGVDRDFPFSEDETRRRFSYFSGTSREKDGWLKKTYFAKGNSRKLITLGDHELTNNNFTKIFIFRVQAPLPSSLRQTSLNS